MTSSTTLVDVIFHQRKKDIAQGHGNDKYILKVVSSQRIVDLLSIPEQKRFLHADNKERYLQVKAFFPESPSQTRSHPRDVDFARLKVVTSQAFASAGRCRLAYVLTNVAGEAIHGWFQFRSDAFGKLIKVKGREESIYDIPPCKTFNFV
ncbi:unnamed protein product [Brassica napus]|uniref:(rape) hypothetical protein n=1 Tax=Brassica napus TaxID=3708 RepID=A0A816XCW8_BRANA|nr:unnamed protein product [Brassica napus]